MIGGRSAWIRIPPTIAIAGAGSVLKGVMNFFPDALLASFAVSFGAVVVAVVVVVVVAFESRDAAAPEVQAEDTNKTIVDKVRNMEGRLLPLFPRGRTGIEKTSTSYL